MSTDLSTQDGWDSFLALLCKDLRHRTAGKSSNIAKCDLILTANPETGEVYTTPRVYTMLSQFSGSNKQEVDLAKNLYADTLMMIATAGCAIGSVFISEAWMSSRTKEEFEKEGPLIPEHDPKRVEGLMMAIYHRSFGHAMRIALIEQVDGKRTVGEWVNQPGHLMEWRFARLVPSDTALEDRDLVKVARTFVQAMKINKTIIPIDDVVEKLEEAENG